MKVAIVHDWLTGMRGGEKCLEVFCELFPGADLYTLIYFPNTVCESIGRMTVKPSWINRLPGVGRYYRYCLPLFPRTIEKFEFDNYDFILSSSHCVAKGIIPSRALHIAYIHSPMRYIWDQYSAYFGENTSWLAKAGMKVCRPYLRRWDLRSAARVHCFIANSNNVAGKIKKLYGREATVIHPPVNLKQFFCVDCPEDYYLIVSALVPYKKIALAIEAFNQLGLPLKIAGDGPLRKKLQAMAGPNVEFLGWVDSAALPRLYAYCQALVLPGEEDFGIAPLEAQASGRPVIAYGKGGTLETVVPLSYSTKPIATGVSPTGIFFEEPTAESLIRAARSFCEKKELFKPEAIRDHASLFDRDRFKTEIKNFLDARWQAHAETR
jgi:glycosyltransferase involved in cell wall biosynthesis